MADGRTAELRHALGAVALACLALAGPACEAGGDRAAAPQERGRSSAADTITIEGLKVPARVQDRRVAVAVGRRFEPRFWAGVNLGSTVPGRFPGEVAATRADYDRWLPAIARLGASVIRVYTILRPAFYDALRSYNLVRPGRPLYVIHGVWIPEEEFLATKDVYSTPVTARFRSELRDAVDVVHGDADLPVRRGHAGGRYRSDVSRWVLAWSPGIEWDPAATAASDRANAGRPQHRGRFVSSVRGSTPMETWIASMLDHVAELEARRGWSRPLTFTNWITTDPLRHPHEPLPSEDLVSIDATHIRATARWPGGVFASYHAYPYYPDFLRRDPGLRTYRRWDGKRDPYAAYLHALRAYHGKQAVMITEFGVPTSIGLAHRGPLGRDQGGHSEQEAGEIDADLLDVIRHEGFAGGIVFEWADEWFKVTWNTVDLESPLDRRQLWRNPLTNEEHFGVIATEPGTRPRVVVDADDREWGDGVARVLDEPSGPVREVRAAHDEEYLYLGLRVDENVWRKKRLVLGFDVRPGRNRGLPGLRGVYPEADVAVTIGAGDRAQIAHSAWTDPFSFQYGLNHGYVPVRRASLESGSGVWVEPRLLLSRPYTVPRTSSRVPSESAGFGRLGWGTADPAADGFDARNLVFGRGEIVELRIPWSYLTFSDPSSHRVWTPQRDGSIATEEVGPLGIAIHAEGGLRRANGYGWDPWNRVSWHEREKKGWAAIAAAMRRASPPTRAAPVP